jgi:hypothetical protein
VCRDTGACCVPPPGTAGAGTPALSPSSSEADVVAPLVAFERPGLALAAYTANAAMSAAPAAAVHFVTSDTRRSPESRALGSFTEPEGTQPIPHSCGAAVKGS